MKVQRWASLLFFSAFCLLATETLSQEMGGEGGGRFMGEGGGLLPGQMPPPGMYGVQPGMMMPGAQPVVITPRPKRKPPAGEKVLTGRRVVDAITKKLLDDVYYDQIPQSRFGELERMPRDDGVWPDLLKDDSIYSNFEVIENQYIGFESNELKKTTIRVLTAAEKLSPQKFFLLNVTATDPYSTLPFNLDKEEERDRKIEEWNRKFLNKYRKNPADPMSSFLPLYVPRPPDFPYSDPPAGFVYMTAAQLAQQQAAGAAGGLAPGGVGAPGPGFGQPGYFGPPQPGPGGAGMLGLGRARNVAEQMNQRNVGGGPGGRRGGGGGGGG
jgi:hypothetical protein